MTTRYLEGATVYELAAEFDICRSKVSERLKQNGIKMRLKPPSDQEVCEMVRLYESGLSLAAAGKIVGVSPGTVLRYLHIQGVQLRDTHERVRKGFFNPSPILRANYDRLGVASSYLLLCRRRERSSETLVASLSDGRCRMLPSSPHKLRTEVPRVCAL